MSDNIVHVTEQSFTADVLESTVPVLLDFWAPWCGPCRQVAPVLEELAETYKGRLKIAKVDIDDNQQLAIRFGVRSIPTLSLFVNGEVVATKVGSQPKSVLTSLIDDHI